MSGLENPAVASSAAMPQAAGGVSQASVSAQTTVNTVPSHISPGTEAADAVDSAAPAPQPDAAAPAIPAGVHVEPAPMGPLTELDKVLAGIKASAGHSEMWGIELKNSMDPPTCIVMQKFLRANNNNVAKATEQLKNALMWRKQFRPLDAVKEHHNKEMFAGLGCVTVNHPSADHGDDTPPTVITWNIYGAVKDKKAFANLDLFLRWRVALMELAIQALKIDKATSSVSLETAGVNQQHGQDPYRMVQVHDYQNVSFLRLDPQIRAASSEVIKIMSMAYPELLDHKFFVNVPYLMNWIFNGFKMFLSKETVAKFHPLAQGTMLANELPSVAASLPGSYGGQGPELSSNKNAIRTRLTGDPSDTGDTSTAATVEPATLPRNAPVVPIITLANAPSASTAATANPPTDASKSPVVPEGAAAAPQPSGNVQPRTMATSSDVPAGPSVATHPVTAAIAQPDVPTGVS